jgi:hypothetical protein
VIGDIYFIYWYCALTDLSTLGVGSEQVDNLDTGDQDFLLDAHLDEFGSFGVDGGEFVGVDRAALIDGLTNDVDDSAQSLGSHGNTDGIARVVDFLAANETLGTVHGNGADGVLTYNSR